MLHRANKPIYEQLLDRYRDDILKYRLQPGQRVDSISEMQEKFGVARDTAKRALKMLAEEGLIVQTPGKGSFVSDMRPRQLAWGLVFPFHSVQYEDLILRISAHAMEQGRELRHFCDYNSYQEETRLVGMMLRERYEAVVIIPTMDESRTWPFYSRLSPRDAPVLLLDHTMTSNDFGFVVQSYDLGVTRAITYLLERTSGGILFVENEIWAGRNMVLELMRETYRELLRRRRPDAEPLCVSQTQLPSAKTLRRLGVTGILCCDDIGAIRTIGSLREQGANTPGDFHVVSYGNTDLARFFTPAITSVDPHNEEMAIRLAAILTGGVMHGEKPQVVIQPELVIRDT